VKSKQHYRLLSHHVVALTDDDITVPFLPLASDCLHKMKELVQKLETSLGPDTGDLEMRVGLHSGKYAASIVPYCMVSFPTLR